MTASDAIGFLLIAGAGWAYWQSRQAAAAPAGPQVIPAAYTVPQAAPQGTDWAGLATGIGDIFGGLQGGQTQAQGAQNGGSQMAGLGSFLNRIFGYTPPAGGSASAPAPTGGGSLAPLLNTIASGEANNGYNSVYAGSPVQPPQPIDTMTVGQVRAFQGQMIAAGAASDAVGRYQFIGGTLQGLIDNGTISSGETFGPAVQDHAATALLNRRGLAQYQAGQMSATDFANNLAKEWASLPVVTGPRAGQSYYAGLAGNKAGVGVSTILSAVQGVA